MYSREKLTIKGRASRHVLPPKNALQTKRPVFYSPGEFTGRGSETHLHKRKVEILRFRAKRELSSNLPPSQKDNKFIFSKNSPLKSMQSFFPDPMYPNQNVCHFPDVIPILSVFRLPSNPDIFFEDNCSNHFKVNHQTFPINFIVWNIPISFGIQ